MDVNKYIGKKIKEIRTRKNETQEELGELLHTTSQTISRYESGKLKISQNVLFEIAKHFNMPLNEFYPPIDTTLTSYVINDNMGTNDITLTQLSAMTNIDRTRLKYIISGEEKLPLPSELKSIASALNEDIETYFICAGYVEDASSDDNQLYETGIRYLLPEKERDIICSFLLSKWKKNSRNVKYDLQNIRNLVFDEEKRTFSDKDIINIMNNSSTKEMFVKWLANNKSKSKDMFNDIHVLKKQIVNLKEMSNKDKKTLMDLLNYFLNNNK